LLLLFVFLFFRGKQNAEYEKYQRTYEACRNASILAYSRQKGKWHDFRACPQSGLKYHVVFLYLLYHNKANAAHAAKNKEVQYEHQ